MSELPKLCPLSLGFSIKQQSPSLLDPKKIDVHVQVGLPCQKERCNWWVLRIEECIIWAIFSEVKKPLGVKTEVV